MANYSRSLLVRQFASVLTVLGMLTMFFIPLNPARSAPVGSPVSLTRNINMSGSNISQLVHHNGTIWALHFNSSQVERFNASTGELISPTISVGANPTQAIIVGGRLFVGGAGSNVITKINLTTGVIEGNYPLSGAGTSALHYDGTHIWALSYNNAWVERFNPSTGAIVGSTISVGGSPGTMVAANDQLFVTTQRDGYLTQIDMPSATRTRTISLSGGDISAVAFDGTTVWASVFGRAEVARINPSTGAVIGYSNVGSNPTNIVFSGSHAWVGSTGSNTVTKLNKSTGAVSANVSLGSNNISNLAYDGEIVWATNYGGSYVSRIDAATATAFAETFATGPQPGSILIVDNDVWVGSLGGNRVTQISGTPAPTTTTTTLPEATTTLPSATTTTIATSNNTTTNESTSSNNASADSSLLTSALNSTTESLESNTTPSALSRVAPRGSTATTTTSVPMTTTTVVNAPEVPDVSTGSAAILINGTESDATISRSNNQLLVSAAGVEMTVWSVNADGVIVPLDEDGNLRVVEGDYVEVELTGLLPEADVEAWMFSTPTSLGKTTTNAQGVAKGKFVVPADIAAGEHRFAVSSQLPDKSGATLAVGIVLGEVTKTSTLARILIAIPLLLAIVFGLVIPTTIRRRRLNQASH